MPFIREQIADLPLSPWRQAPLLRYALLLVVGIVCAWSLRWVMSTELWLCILLLLVMIEIAGILWCKWFRQGKSIVVVSALVIAVASGTLLQSEYEQVHISWPQHPLRWTAEVLSVHKQNEWNKQIDVRLTGAHIPHEGVRVRVRCEPVQGKYPQPADSLEFYATMGYPFKAGNPGDFDYTTYLLTHGISGTAYVGKAWSVLPRKSKPELQLRLLAFRQQLLLHYASHLQGETLAILSALTLGDKSSLDTETRQLFSETGASHVLALSGLHLGILFSLLHFLVLRWIRCRSLYVAANFLSIAILWLFVLLAGSPFSLLRAAAMLTLFQIGNALRRTGSATLNNLALAAVVLLLISPMSLFDVGFQLSFAAVLSILLFNAYVWQRIPLPVWDESYVSHIFPPRLGVQPSKPQIPHSLRLLYLKLQIQQRAYQLFRQYIYPFITVSISAQLGTAPLVLYYFHTFTPYALLANVVVIPSAYLLLGGSLIYLVCPFETLRSILGNGLQDLIALMTSTLNQMSHWPGAVWHFYPSVVSLGVLVLFPVLLFAFFHSRLRRLRLWLLGWALFLVALAVGIEVWHTRPSRIPAQIVVYNVSRNTAIHFICDAGHSYLYASLRADSLDHSMRYIRQNYWDVHRMSRPQQLTETAYRDKHLLRAGNYFVFGRTRVMVLNQTLSAESSVGNTIVQMLVVSRGCYNTLFEVMQHIRPQQVVLDASLGQHVRSQWVQQCAELHLPCHDVRTQGAFVYKIH